MLPTAGGKGGSAGDREGGGVIMCLLLGKEPADWRKELAGEGFI